MTTMTDLPLDLQRVIYGLKFHMEHTDALNDVRGNYDRTVDKHRESLGEGEWMMCLGCCHTFLPERERKWCDYRRCKNGEDEMYILCGQCSDEIVEREPTPEEEDEADEEWHVSEDATFAVGFEEFIEKSKRVVYAEYRMMSC